MLKKDYFGGGTVEMIDSSKMIVHQKKVFHEVFEDGSLPFLDINSLKHGFDTLQRLTGPLIIPDYC